MPHQAHTLMQHANDLNNVALRPVDDDMGADEIEAMRLGQFRATVAEIGIVANRFHSLVELVAVNQQLVFTPRSCRCSGGCWQCPAGLAVRQTGNSQGRTSGSIGFSLCMSFSAVCVMLSINSAV